MSLNKRDSLMKKHLLETLKELLRTDSFSKISVKKICEVAQVNRKSFYYHFEDKYDICEYMLIQELIEPALLMAVDNSSTEILKYVFDYVDENSTILKSLFHGSSYETYKRIFSKNVSRILYKSAMQHSTGRNPLKYYGEFITDFYVGAILSLIEKRLNNEANPYDDDVIDYISQTLTAHLTGIKHSYASDDPLKVNKEHSL